MPPFSPLYSMIFPLWVHRRRLFLCEAPYHQEHRCWGRCSSLYYTYYVEETSYLGHTWLRVILFFNRMFPGTVFDFLSAFDRSHYIFVFFCNLRPFNPFLSYPFHGHFEKKTSTFSELNDDSYTFCIFRLKKKLIKNFQFVFWLPFKQN